MHEIEYQDLNDLQIKALTKAAQALRYAYDPYSGFSVGAALATPEGKVFCGVNVANAASGSTICAERGAILHAYAHGHRKFKYLAIIGQGKDSNTTEVTEPCGACCQMLHEAQIISGNEIIFILSTTKKDKIALATLKDFFPHGFGPDKLGVDISKFREERLIPDK